MSSGPTGPTISHARTFIITAYLYFAFFFLSLFFLLYLSRIINRGLMYFPRRKWNLRVRTIFPRNNIYVCINIRLLTLPPFPPPGGRVPRELTALYTRTATRLRVISAQELYSGVYIAVIAVTIVIVIVCVHAFAHTRKRFEREPLNSRLSTVHIRPVRYYV